MAQEHIDTRPSANSFRALAVLIAGSLVAAAGSPSALAQDYRPISESEGHVRFVGEGIGVAERKAADWKGGYVEQLVMTNRALVIHWTINANSAMALSGRSGYFASNGATTVYSLRMFVQDGDFAKRFGAEFDDRKVKSAGDVAYITTASPQGVCFFGFGIIGVPVDQPRSGIVPDPRNRANLMSQGIKTRLCFRSNKTEADLEAEMLGMLARARFDDGSSLEIPDSRIATGQAKPSQEAPTILSNGQAAAPPQKLVPTSDTARRLQTLKEIYDKGLIDRSEYEARKKAILDAL
jgi:hypothetical protein